ncbi:MAG TPA: dihydrofolate reductase family protein [Gaiella sp.]
MRKLVATTFMTLDGVMQAPGGPGEDDDGGFAHGGWSVGYWDERMGELAGEIHLAAGGVVFGRRTYEILAGHWPKVGDDDPLAAKLNAVPKYVASRSARTLDWNNSTLLEGDVPEAVARLKAQDGDYLLVIGSADLLQTLLRNDLVDTFKLWTFPVVVGEGKRLFGDGAVPAGLALADIETATTGVTVATYERAGEIAYGSFALEE